MTCPTCQPLAATSEQQFDNRVLSIAELPGASINPCHACGGTDWATTTEFIKPPRASGSWISIGGRPPEPFWRRLMEFAWLRNRKP